MKGRVIALGRHGDRAAAAMLNDGKLEDLLVDPPDAALALLPGTIVRAVAGRPMKGQGGMMLDLPQGRGFLRQTVGCAPGKPLLAQVSGYAEPGKAVPMTGKLMFKGRYAIVTPGAPGISLSRRMRDENRRAALDALARGFCPGELGVILRSAAETADLSAISGELSRLIDVARTVLADADDPSPALLMAGPGAHELALRDWPATETLADDPDAFDHFGVVEALAQMRRPAIDLPARASAWIEPTRALVAVDVNTGADISAAAGLKANVALARDLPRQLRCRGLGGQITIDFAPFPKRDRRQVEQALRQAFRADPVDTALVGWTPLGHFELQRKRERCPLI